MTLPRAVHSLAKACAAAGSPRANAPMKLNGWTWLLVFWPLVVGAVIGAVAVAALLLGC